MADHKMTEEQYRDLVSRSRLEGGAGDDVIFACDVREDDHLHLARMGAPGSGLGGRVAVKTHGGVIVLFAADETRKIAAALLNLADELDGSTPLVFHPPRFVSGADLDTPGADE